MSGFGFGRRPAVGPLVFLEHRPARLFPHLRLSALQLSSFAFRREGTAVAVERLSARLEALVPSPWPAFRLGAAGELGRIVASGTGAALRTGNTDTGLWVALGIVIELEAQLVSDSLLGGFATGLAALEQVEALGGAGGPYAPQAAIAACHARAQTAERTDWKRIAVLYYALAQRTPHRGAQSRCRNLHGLSVQPALVDALRREPALGNYHLLPSVRGDLLEKLGRFTEARAEFERAAALTKNAREQEVLLARAARCAGARG